MEIEYDSLPSSYFIPPALGSNDCVRNVVLYLRQEHKLRANSRGVYLIIDGIVITSVQQTGKKTCFVGDKIFSARTGYNTFPETKKLAAYAIELYKEKKLTMKEIFVAKAPMSIQGPTLKSKIKEDYPSEPAWKHEAIFKFKERTHGLATSIHTLLVSADVDNWDGCVTYAETILTEQGLNPFTESAEKG